MDDVKYYTCKGHVRDYCGHKHRTLSGAVSCHQRDRRYCAQSGGYSDRGIYAVSPEGDEVEMIFVDDHWISWDEYEQAMAREYG